MSVMSYSEMAGFLATPLPMTAVYTITNEVLSGCTQLSKEDRAYYSGVVTVMTAAAGILMSDSNITAFWGSCCSVLAGTITAKRSISNSNKEKIGKEATEGSLFFDAAAAAVSAPVFGPAIGSLLGAGASYLIYVKDKGSFHEREVEAVQEAVAGDNV